MVRNELFHALASFSRPMTYAAAYQGSWTGRGFGELSVSWRHAPPGEAHCDAVWEEGGSEHGGSTGCDNGSPAVDAVVTARLLDSSGGVRTEASFTIPTRRGRLSIYSPN